MHRIDGPAAAPGGLFTEGDPNVGTPATVVTDDWLNTVQTELENVAISAGATLSKPNNAQVLQAIQALIARAVPPGAVQPFAMSTVPTGWLACNGQLVSRAAYPALFSAIGTTYSVGDGSTTFGVPELRGEFIRGLDQGRGVDAGRAIGSAQADEIKLHDHELAYGFGGGESIASQVAFDAFTAQGDERRISGAVIGRGGTETRPRNVALAYCIRT